MTIQTFIPSTIVVVDGVGPYTVSHPYRAGSLRVSVQDEAGVVVDLLLAEFTVSPAKSTTTGAVTLTEQAAIDHDGKSLLIARATSQEQGWVAGAGPREAGLAAQLDDLTMMVQEISHRQAFGAYRSSFEDPGELRLPNPVEGQILVGSADGWENGPTVEQVETWRDEAEGFSQSASTSAAAAAASASAAAAFDGPWFSTYQELLDDTGLTYTADLPGTVAVGDFIWAGGRVVEVAASDAEDHHGANSGGTPVKYYEAGSHFSSRARLVAAHDRNVAAGRTVPAGTVWSWPDFSIVLMPAGHAAYGTDPIADLAGWAPFGDVYPDHFAENTTPGTTDMITAIQAAIDYVADAFGGGVVHFTYNRYAISSTIQHKRAVYLRGRGYFFNNDYVASTDTLTGSCLFVLAGSNCDALLVRADVSDLSGSSFPRQYGGIENMAVHGNKSQSNSRTATDLNSTGNGILIQGVSYFDMKDVLTYRCAEDGVATESYDYGDGNGARSCNNLHWSDIRAIHNAGNGYSVFAGDSHFSQIVGGYNGLDGWNGNGQPLSTALFWNNGRRGITVSSSNDGANLSGVRAYDNAHSGIYLSSGDYHQLIGCASFDNGQAETGVAAEEAGVVIAGTADKITMVGCEIAPHGDTTQLRGIYSTITGLDLTLGSNRISGHATADLSLSDFSGVKLHGDTGSNIATHPGFALTSDILQNGNVVYDAGASSVTINTAGSNLFDAGTNGAMWLVVVAHAGGAQAGHAFVLGDATTPLIISQDTGGGQTVTFSVSSTTIRATAGTSNFTGSWRAMRLA